MSTLSLIAFAVAVQTNPQPDIYSLVPDIIDVAVEKSSWSGRGGYPADRPIAIDFSSFVREFAKVTSRNEAKLSNVVQAMKKYRVVKGQAQPWCASEECREIGTGQSMIFVTLRDLETTPDGYQMRISLTYPHAHEGRYVSALVSFGVAFEWNGTKWIHRFVGDEIRT